MAVKKVYALSGSPIYHYDEADRVKKAPVPPDHSIDKIAAHIRKHIGEITQVFHEETSDSLCIDVLHIAPNERRNCHTFVTRGMSLLPMTVPPGAKDSPYAELMISLPPEWPICSEAGCCFWPFKWLKKLACFPHEYQTWLGRGHTMPNGDPPEPFAENTRLSAFILLPSSLYSKDFFALEIDGEKTIHFLSVIPIYGEERDFKLRHGFTAFWKRLRGYGVSEPVDIERENICISPR